LAETAKKWHSVENFLVSAQNRECFSAIMHHIHGGVGVWGVWWCGVWWVWWCGGVVVWGVWWCGVCGGMGVWWCGGVGGVVV
jgi:hypothetical protein